jgi:hypothetical protein
MPPECRQLAHRDVGNLSASGGIAAVRRERGVAIDPEQTSACALDCGAIFRGLRVH